VSDRFWVSLGLAIVIVLLVFVAATLTDQW
jgi:hypothetical protein